MRGIEDPGLELSLVMACLDEVETLEVCVRNEGLRRAGFSALGVSRRRSMKAHRIR